MGRNVSSVHLSRVVTINLFNDNPAFIEITLRYSRRDGHAEGEHVNRGTDTPSFSPTLQVLDMSTLGDAADRTCVAGT
jgi:hypothetical protein